MSDRVLIQVWTDPQGQQCVTLWQGNMTIAQVEPNEDTKGKADGFYDEDWNSAPEPTASDPREEA